MTFKEFVAWCNERACDGCWGYLTAMQCIEVLRDVRTYPFWKREKYWKHHYMHSTVIEMVEQTNRKIAEVYGERKDNGNNI
jgi:hypothetical protein